MSAPKDGKPKNTRVVVGTYKETSELLPNGLTKEVREEKTVTLRRRELPETGNRA